MIVHRRLFLALVPIFLAFSGSAALSAPDAKKLIEALGSDSFQERTDARKSLVNSISDQQSPALAMLSEAGNSDDPEVKAQAEKALHEVFARLVLGAGQRELGVRWSYWLDRGKDSLRTHPMILEVGDKGFMAKAGFKAGDVLISCGGKQLFSRNSITRIKEMLEVAPDGKPLTCKVSRGGAKLPFGARTGVIELKVMPDASKSAGRREEPREYEKWLQSLGK